MAKKRRLCLARALINRPEILLADEPTAGLGDKAERAIMRLIAEVNAAGTPVVVADAGPLARGERGWRSLRHTGARGVLKSGDAHGHGVRDDPFRPTKVVAVFVAAAFVALFFSIVAIAGAATLRVASMLQPRLAGQVTIVVWGQGLESADAAAARTAEILSGQAGVRRVTVLDADDSDAMVGALTAGRPTGVEGARLVSVSGAPDLIPSTSSLRGLLRATGLAATIDDHRGTEGPLETAALVAGGVALVLGLALAIGLFAVSFQGGLHAVGAGRSRYDLMARLGADPAYIGAVVARRSAGAALVGAVVGTVCADLGLAATMLDGGFWRGLGVAAFAQPQPGDAAWTVASPLVAMAIAAIGGGIGARRGIVRRERGI